MSELKEENRQEEKAPKEKKGKGFSIVAAYMGTKMGMTIMGIAAVLFAIGGFSIGISRSHETIDKTQQIGFVDIGELATQSSYTTQVKVVEDAKTVYGIKIPGTTTKMIFSYDVETKAGYNFSSIQWEVNENTITVRLPEAQIFSNALQTDSFQVYHESESIFTPYDLETNNQAQIEMEAAAQEKAIENGLLERARENAEIIITAFFAGVYDMDEYTIEFVDAQ